ncbi:TetR/AcrR family transcriptional regulator [Rhodococcus sp. 24CO]|uniref:TetR/AcrR family transcriptional regulator n=1 Tax=Rhodococcus sp. 24CO TaxID=3117460 RepID=UPI003D353B02
MRPVPALQRADFFRAGLDLLREHGSSNVTAVALCERLGVTRGSFYHHFASFEEYLEGLLDYWADYFTWSRRQILERERELARRSDVFIGLAIELPHDLENAIRAWATIHPAVREAVRKVEATRVAYIEHSLRRAGCDADTATLYAQLAHSSFIGLEAKGIADDEKLIRRIFEEIEWAVSRRIGMDSPRRE